MVEEVETSSIMEESIRVQPIDNEDLEDGEIVEHDDSSSSKPRLPAEVHPLERSWTFWFDIPSPKSKHSDWGSNLRPIHTFSTAEEFWGLYNNIHHPSKLCAGADLYCFIQEAQPKWEDKVCADGGKWTVNCNRGKADILWLYTLLAIIGEQFDHGDKICGAVVNIRAKQEKISLWTKNAINETAQISIGKQWKELLDCNDTIGFIVHEDAMNKITKNRYSV